MKKTILLFSMLCASVIMMSCGSKYNKTKDGILWKKIQGDHTDTTKIKENSFVKIKIKQYIGDSLLQGESPMPMYMPASNLLPEATLGAQVGDMIEVAIPVDSILAKNPYVPPFVQRYKGRMMKTEIRILGIFDSLPQVDADKVKMMEPFKAKEDSEIVAYLKANNIQAEKQPNGTYIEVLSKGTGSKVGDDKPYEVSVRYKGSLLKDGSVFDENMSDSAIKAKKPVFTFQTKSHQVVEGFDYAVTTMSKGERIRVYIPAVLAYGEKAMGTKIPAFSNLIFELSLENFKTPEVPKMPPIAKTPLKPMKK